MAIAESTDTHPRSAVIPTTRHVASCLIPQLLFVLLGLGVLGGGAWTLLPAVFMLLLLPLLDAVTGWQDDVRYDKRDFTSLELGLLRWNPRAYAILHVLALGTAIAQLDRFDALETGCLIVSFSLLGAIGFAAAHELLHGKHTIDHVLQRVLTAVLFYPHYKLIHIRSHHVHTGTELDENTAWRDEGVYRYLARTVTGSFLRCWDLEARRVAKQQSAVPAFLRNDMWLSLFGQGLLIAAVGLVAGGAGLLFYVALTLGAHLVLESVNYIQHYGLMRERSASGEYERTGPQHSWDTYHYFSSYLTFRVGHHSNHHMRVQPYYLLAPEPHAPKLPVGYLWAIAVVLLPPWWRALINPKLAPRP